jgi:hypothetical protein
MSYPQLIKNDRTDYYTDLYDQHKTAKYLKAATRIVRIDGVPAVGDGLIVQSLGAGTYASPDVASFEPIFGPGGLTKSIAVQFGPTSPSAVGLNPSAVLNGMPVVNNSGFTYQSGLGRILQTFGADKLYYLDASVSLTMPNTQAVGEVLVSLYLYDVDLAATSLLSSDYIVTQPFTPTSTRSCSLSAQIQGRANPASYFYVQIDATDGALPLNVGVSFVRFAITAM